MRVSSSGNAEPWHGTSAGYRHHGCRCEPCRAGELERQHERHAAGDAPNHGTYSGYKNYGCRCDACRAAWAAAGKAYRARRAARLAKDEGRG